MLIKERSEFKNKSRPLSCGKDITVQEAVEKMAQKNYGAIIVVDDDDMPVGIVSERDLMKRMLARGLDPKKTKVSDIMTENLYVAKEDDNLLEWLRLMSNERFRHLPVVDSEGKVLCMMSQGDFVSYTWPELMNQIKDTAKASIAPNYQIVLIVLAMLLYVVIVPILFNLLS